MRIEFDDKQLDRIRRQVMSNQEAAAVAEAIERLERLAAAAKEMDAGWTSMIDNDSMEDAIDGIAVLRRALDDLQDQLKS